MENKNKKKKAQGCLNLKCSVIVSYLVSITSNILLGIILFLSEHAYKWIGFLLHVTILALAFLSLKNLITRSNSSKSLLKFKSLTKFFTINLIVTGVFYGIIIIYLFATKQDQDLIFYFAFCIIIWCIFHGLFISIIRAFIKSMEDRPAKKSPDVKLIDKNLRELILSQNTNM